MKAKTIRAILRKKIDAWLASIDDEDLRKACKRDTIVTGGCIASMLLKEKVNDFDLYFRTKQTALDVAKYYVTSFMQNPPPSMLAKDGVPVPIAVDDTDDRVRIVVKSAGVIGDESESPYQYFESDDDPDAIAASAFVGEIIQDPGAIEDAYEEAEASALEQDTKPPYRPVFLSTNAITLSNKIQIIIRFHGEPDEIHANYDYVHCTNYWTSNDSQLTLRQPALEALLARELRYVGSKYPLCSIIRMRKFIRRGWSINAGQILKMAMQLNELDLTNVSVLEDQLTGVDVAYFNEVIEKLKEKDPEKVQSAYLLEIIDRMF